jgi:lipopolysaccharide/colanic/teichoic acid biosynthesis glycosyltransferase
LFAGAGLAVSALPMAAIAAIHKLTMKGPVFYLQPRQGLNGEYFNIYKFKSMTDDRDTAGNLLPDRERITPFGRFLRRTSLDELPQFLNILKGDMSLIGPRPAYFHVPDRYKDRFLVRPGLTGLAQIRGRKDCSLDERLSADLEYVKVRAESPVAAATLDLKIAFNTVSAVVSGKGTGVKLSGPQAAENPDYRMTAASQRANAGAPFGSSPG